MTKPRKQYVVTFHKTVTTSNGSDRDVVQKAIEVSATDEKDALEQAKGKFCHLDGLGDWSQHADRYDVEQAGFPS